MTEERDLSFTLIGRAEERRFVDVCLQRRLNCLVVGRAGVGKTTLLNYVARRAPSVDPRFRSVVVDCMDIGSPNRLLELIVRRITDESGGTEIPLPALPHDRSSTRIVFEHLRNLVAQKNVIPVICIDSLDCLPEAVLSYIGRQLMYLTETESVIFAASRDASPALPSFLVNRFQTLYLGPLALEDIREAIHEHFAAQAVTVSPNLTEKIGELSGGHPLLLKLILSHLSATGGALPEQLSALKSELESALPISDSTRRLTPGQRALRSSAANNAVLETLSKKK